MNKFSHTSIFLFPAVSVVQLGHPSTISTTGGNVASLIQETRPPLGRRRRKTKYWFWPSFLGIIPGEGFKKKKLFTELRNRAHL